MCSSSSIFTSVFLLLSLCSRHSRRSAPCSRAPQSEPLKEEIYFLFNFPTQNLRARKGSNQRPRGGKAPFFLAERGGGGGGVTAAALLAHGSSSQVSCPLRLAALSPPQEVF